MSTLIGHAAALDLLRRLCNSGRLGSALLIVGASGVGKRALVEEVFGSLTLNPNAMVLVREVNDKTEELKKNIGIEQVADLVARMSLSGFGNAKKIGLIDGAEWLSTNAANALLKTLEDPMGDTLMILLTTSTASIPATVLSRCQVLHLPLVADGEIERALVDRGADAELANEVVGLAGGRPGVALTLLADAELLARYREQRDQLMRLVSASVPEKLGLLGGYAKVDKAELEQTLDAWEIFLHAQGQLQTLKQLIQARTAIRQNVNPTLALEHAFI